MAYPYEVELTITSAKDLKNINWRYGPLRPYAVAWIDPNNKCSTRVDEEHDNNPYWDETVIIPLPLRAPLRNSTLLIDIVHACNADDHIKPLIGSAQLNLDDVGINKQARLTLHLERPSGRPHGKVEIMVAVREPRYPGYGAPLPAAQSYEEPYVVSGAGYPSGVGTSAPETEKSKFGGKGTGLAVGAVAGVLGGVALVEGADYIEDKIADEFDVGYDGW